MPFGPLVFSAQCLLVVSKGRDSEEVEMNESIIMPSSDELLAERSCIIEVIQRNESEKQVDVSKVVIGIPALDHQQSCFPFGLHQACIRSHGHP